VSKGGVGGVSKCRDVTKILLQPIRFCAELARLLTLQSGNSPTVDERAEAVWRNGFPVGTSFCMMVCISTIVKNVKGSRYRPGVAQSVGRGIALLFHDRGTRRG